MMLAYRFTTVKKWLLGANRHCLLDSDKGPERNHNLSAAAPTQVSTRIVFEKDDTDENQPKLRNVMK